MLVPRETDIPALFLIFVVLPLVTYFILGKWSEASKRKESLSSIAGGASEEALQVEDMAVGTIMPVVNIPISGIHQCARCFAPAGTRCSQCKSVWYCSGRCQIVHWRQVHKLECQQLGKDCRGRVSFGETTDNCTSMYNMQQPPIDSSSSKDFDLQPLSTLSTFENSMISQQSSDIGEFLSGQIDSPRTANGAVINFSGEASGISFTLPNSSQPSEDPPLREGHANSPCAPNDGGNRIDIERRNALDDRRILCSDESKGSNCPTERTSMKRSSKSKAVSYSNGVELHKYQKSRMMVSKEQLCPDAEPKTQTAKESGITTTKDNFHVQESNRAANLDLMRVKGLKKPTKVDSHQHLEVGTVKKRKVKMIFPYEEFVKCFQYEILNVTPRGLVNCGNSCYANAVLQCLTFTKPLSIYLLRQTHSRAGCAKDWCLTCELERLVMMLRQNGGPLSPVNILIYIRSLNNTQIGDGSQEDAHEFLRLLVASMQSICLEGYGGENAVDPRLQDTTFIQHTFGGSLRSKVKCSRCHHESERYEKMMDLTLEIFGWVESLEDALTQFTSPEDLDGDNMYRCARCATYVRARKQLHIKEAPNILTIVLKRFQEGNYGKINKCITFPEMLDMIPFMTGTDDIPPLYMLYAVVVHLDTSNASFSGHYISYVKDLQGNWFRIDDTEVQPVELSQVMSEGAYILFYMRSYPRPTRVCNGKSTRHQPPCDVPPKVQKASRQDQSNLSHNLVAREPCPETNPESSGVMLLRENRSRPSVFRNYAEFSDPATSSDWSHFTSSDDSSFTTDGTRDSVDHSDLPFSSIFRSMYPEDSPSRRFAPVSCVNYGGGGRRGGGGGVAQTSVGCTI